ncbi:response regulator [Leptolyngbya sp. FACHB-541]|nr:response regulator [Leptolyngbya sp. FACHB-541]
MNKSSLPSKRRFSALRHTIWFLKNLQQLHFSGQLVHVVPAGQQWTFYLSQGSIVYAMGGTHPVRRWRRNLAIHCSWIGDRDMAPDAEFDRSSADLTIGWEYALLKLWVTQQKITREHAARVIRDIVIEVLFDVTQAVDLTDQVNQDRSLSTFAHLGLVDVGGAIAQVERLQRTWQDAKLGDYSPNKAPVIKQQEQLRKLSSARFYENLVELLDGQQTLRDLSVKMQRDVAAIATSLLPFVRMGWVGFISIADLPTPVLQKQPPKALAPAIPKKPVEEPVANPLIACIDDSFWVCNMMEKIIASAGYQFVGVNDPLRAISILLSRKPDLIFLDLVMPTANGYEICEKLRKISCFRDTPIVILTGNDGFVSRLRSSSAGATDFLTKPLEAEAVLGAVRKHLNQGIASNHAPTDRDASRENPVSGSASGDPNTARFSVATDH